MTSALAVDILLLDPLDTSEKIPWCLRKFCPVIKRRFHRKNFKILKEKQYAKAKCSYCYIQIFLWILGAFMKQGGGRENNKTEKVCTDFTSRLLHWVSLIYLQKQKRRRWPRASNVNHKPHLLGGKFAFCFSLLLPTFFLIKLQTIKAQ